MTTFSVAPDVHGIELGLEGTVAAYLLDDERPTVIETGMAESTDRLLDGVRDLGVDPATVEHVVPGHAHLDHAGGARALLERAPDATVYVHESMVEWLTDAERLDRLVESSREALGDSFAAIGAPDGPLPEERVEPVPGLEFRVVGEDGSAVPWDDESVGELHVRGPTVATEYYRNPAATAEAFDGDWLATGDLVTVDADGYVSVVDRDDDIIKSGGEWISSVELENTMMGHDAVSEATVVGVDHERWGERPLGFVVVADGATVDEDALREALRDRIQAAYPKWWTPDEIRFVDAVPKTATGKFDKQALRNEYADHSVESELSPDE